MEKPHKKLRAWKLGMDIAKEVYAVTAGFPSEERFGLVSQMRRCAVSIPSNIAEGAARSSDKEFLNFLHISLASLSELDTQLELSSEFGFISAEIWGQIDERLTEEDKVLTGLIKQIMKKIGNKA